MPVQHGLDKNGYYYQWGSLNKYYYDPSDPEEKEAAREAAKAQGQAVKAERNS